MKISSNIADKSKKQVAPQRSGFTRLDNETDLGLLRSLSAALWPAAILLMKHRNLNNPVVTIAMVMEFCGLSRTRAYEAMASLNCAEKQGDGWVFCPEYGTRDKPKQSRKRDTKSRKRDNSVPNMGFSVPNMGFLPTQNPVQNGETEAPKEVEVKNYELKSITTHSVVLAQTEPASRSGLTEPPKPEVPPSDPLAELAGELGLFLRQKLEASPGKLAVWLPKALWFFKNSDLQTLRALWAYCHRTAEHSPGSMFFAFANSSQALPEAVRLELSSAPPPIAAAPSNPTHEPQIGDFAEWNGHRYEIHRILGRLFMQTLDVSNCKNGEPDMLYTKQCRVIPRCEVTDLPYVCPPYFREEAELETAAA